MKRKYLWLLPLCLWAALLGSFAHALEAQASQRITAGHEPGPSDALMQPAKEGEADPPKASPMPAPPWQMGNTPGNYAGGMLALQAEGDFFWSVDIPECLAFVLNPDNTLTRIKFKAEQYLDGWFYYDSSSSSGKSSAIWRCRNHGENRKQLLTDIRIVQWQVAGDFLYVLEDIDLPYESCIPEHQLWRIHLDTGERMLYPLGNVADFALSEQYLFVTYVHREGFDRIDLNGNPNSIVELPLRPYLFFFQEDWLYYLVYEDKQGAAYRCRADGSEAELLALHAAQALHYDEGWLYYFQFHTEISPSYIPQYSILVRKNLATGEEQVLDAEERRRHDFAIVGPHVLLHVIESTGEAYSISALPWIVPKHGGTPQELTHNEIEQKPITWYNHDAP